MTTHRVNDIVRGKQSSRLALVKEVGERMTTFEYLEGVRGEPVRPNDVVQRLPQMFEPVRPDAVGQYARHEEAPALMGKVVLIDTVEDIAIVQVTEGRAATQTKLSELVRVAEPEKLDKPASFLYFPSDGDVERFKRAWEKADREGKYGERVRAGLEASISFVVSEIIAERDRRGRVLEEVRAERDAVQDHAAFARDTAARTIEAKDGEIERLRGELVALRPDPDAAAKAALARFHDYSEERAESFWHQTTEAGRNAWRRVAAS